MSPASGLAPEHGQAPKCSLWTEKMPPFLDCLQDDNITGWYRSRFLEIYAYYTNYWSLKPAFNRPGTVPKKQHLFRGVGLLGHLTVRLRFRESANVYLYL